LFSFADQVGQGHAHILEDHFGGGHHADAHLLADVGGGKDPAIRFHQDHALPR
jgi:hypothetical protein